MKHYQVDVQQRGPGIQNYKSLGRMTVQADDENVASELAQPFINRTREIAALDPKDTVVVISLAVGGGA